MDYLKKSAKVSKYSGLISQIYVSFPAAAVFFSMYDLSKFYLIKSKIIFKKLYLKNIFKFQQRNIKKIKL